jgi:tRNA threonylcarbamoyladenosine biosynthesis protein TsaB
MASERLVATVRELVERAGMRVGEIDVVAVVHGPGSFTGVRVGLSAAKGLCEAVGAKLVAISRLAVLARMAGEGDAATVYAAIDAGRGELYFAEYVDDRCVREALLTRDEVIASGADGVVVYEAAVAEALATLRPRLVPEPTAEDALGLALRRLQALSFDDVAAIDANYLRRTDAQIFAKAKG